MTMRVALDDFLTQDADVCGGRLRIKGTRMTVHQVVTLYKSGFAAEEIVDQYPHLELAQVYAALASYHANREAIEASLAAELEEADRFAAQHRQLQKRSA